MAEPRTSEQLRDAIAAAAHQLGGVAALERLRASRRRHDLALGRYRVARLATLGGPIERAVLDRRKGES
jgi:hypothetical protein